ncbi:uncharacterized protein [Physcomitrium patens]|uniref:Plastid lipid-associated protein/fibrillin conserved domain-containing protein n=1 Tax=Physcomitrium patens TaxID=3218 RepID=A0A7I4BSS7_PHYPA|nr:uncharacterized protein LOC112286911 isoform X2 [Physcomitrium patens]|eukprot:XP_024385213.1 uncharacterized protein LOC112286911 isoform X2 [Physcomitrella patens]
MLVLVGPESVTSPCIGSSGSARALDPQIGKFSLQRGKSRVRLVRAGIGMRKMENLRIRVLSRRLHCDQFSPRPAIQSRRVVRSQAQDDDYTTEVSTSDAKQEKEQEMMMGWRLKAVEAVTSVFLVFGPGIDMNDKMRAGSMLMDKMVGGFKSSKVLDKVVTVVSGQVVVNPDELEKDIKEIIEKPESFEKWRNGLLDNAIDTIGSAVDGISAAVDAVTHLSPQGLQESVSTSVAGVFEVGAERFAAFELQSLVGLTERWLIYIPLVVLPMAWQMRARSSAAAADARERDDRRLVVSKEVEAKAERVRRELERIKLKASLMDLINSMGEVALQRLQNGTQSNSSEISDIVNQLKTMNPGYEVQLNPRDPGSTMRSGSANDAFSTIPAAPQLDGEWKLVYTSQPLQNRDLPQVPGVEIHNPRQQVWNQGSGSIVNIDADTAGSSLLMAKNVAELRLGPLGLVEVAIQGSWESLRNGQAGLVSFDTFLVRPKEILGTLFDDDLPPVSFPLPQQFQSTAEWEVLYLDETLRINRDQQGELYIFTRKA